MVPLIALFLIAANVSLPAALTLSPEATARIEAAASVGTFLNQPHVFLVLALVSGAITYVAARRAVV